MITWRKAGRSGGGGAGSQECVEAARLDDGVGLRDSKDPDTGHLTVSPGAFGDLLGRIRAGDLDL
ncbi:DUF397 domain-containing protein [Actinomadura sp. HBU206391]|uniref:DUF397 domain-containing protein n=1 Tax=Actinomadura sp. HBU206391 TaxID=2731692 RepID=UPI00165082D6|nr:DUF397 domain-containing protein [Actinomadura sp. HBU206391]MBC6459174.1 DUF397 domain-containing protein [Actinomadura sp. HBU206391]